MKCPKCGNEMLWLFTSCVCEACDTGETPVAIEVEDSIGIRGGRHKSLIMDSQVSTNSPPFTTAAFSYQKIGMTGFYYDPRYAKKVKCTDADFQIGDNTVRYVFSKEGIKKLLGWINSIPKNFDQDIDGVRFKYDNSMGTGLLEINNRWGFVAQGIDKIYKFFEPLVAP